MDHLAGDHTRILARIHRAHLVHGQVSQTQILHESHLDAVRLDQFGVIQQPLHTDRGKIRLDLTFHSEEIKGMASGRGQPNGSNTDLL